MGNRKGTWGQQNLMKVGFTTVFKVGEEKAYRLGLIKLKIKIPSYWQINLNYINQNSAKITDH